MPAYEICYRQDDGSLMAKFAAQCQGDLQAKVLAHAMRVDGARQLEVWNGKTLIYTRPERPS